MSASTSSSSFVIAEVQGGIGLLTLNRPQALNALSLSMIRDITRALLAWRDDAAVQAVVVRGATLEGKGVAFCAGGDIRFFHQAALAGNPELEDFFTEEYALNHLIHTYPKPYVALMDGIVMGGGMGISQGASLRVVTERTKMAMPETHIGLFPDVGGGWFLARCPGRLGEYLALTGQILGAGDAIACGLADVCVASGELPALVEALVDQPHENAAQLQAAVRARAVAPAATSVLDRAAIDRHFAAESLIGIVESLKGDSSEWAQATLATLGKRSPLMMAVTLEQVRRARTMTLADDLRMERDLVRRCFQLRPGAASETVEGIRALAVDKDHNPRWNPARIDDVTPAMVAAFFESPWPGFAHPLAGLNRAA
ncbi:enoyl-CoA hydratase/isomerase family protein [Rhizobacter sp. SG703]|uniref:enoyl-CoA hydratase/isomerase family protein n=1 Tax=Rhizobacter sp. SG703 TaxID=2587140 RepID=UPI0014462ABA|nr:enoyl-CoA hydratase/isomerase family protein [Rhizobacter sp. SG703]NKI92096.1 enoyl-CoA hydratase [Rhizobacter sp. SG703]